MAPRFRRKITDREGEATGFTAGLPGANANGKGGKLGLFGVGKSEGKRKAYLRSPGIRYPWVNFQTGATYGGKKEGIVVPSGRARSPRGPFPAFWPPDVSARFRKGYPYGHFRGFLNAAGKDHGCRFVRKRRIRSGCSVSSAILFRFTAPHFKHWWIS